MKHLPPIAVLLISPFFLATHSLASADGPSGAGIYKSQCARCHGAQGEGVEDYCPDPLHGDRSLQDLIEVVDETMPEEEPEKCTGKAAKSVAEYIYETFYTAEARARNKPPRIELSHMTVRQYANATADLIGEFTGQGKLGEARGLKARYYNARNFRGDKKVFDRVDAHVDIDFSEGSPDKDKIGKEEFSIQWQGGVIAPDTGDYEFCLKTENGARLWVNNNRTALIDAWVKSGDETEYRATVRLLGGRAYPIRLDFFKFKEKSASVTLRWQPPHRVEEVIPQRCLSPDWFPQVLVVHTPFPPDDSSVGYERGTSVSKAWDEATTYAAIEIANKVVGNLAALSGAKDDVPDRETRLKAFCYRLAERAFRRPLTDDQRRFFVDQYFDGSAELDSAVKKVVLLALKSPRFLYPELDIDEIDDYDVASRLSFGLWDSLPDHELLKAAAQGQLRTTDQIEKQTRRMLGDARTRAKLRDFFHKWLHVERAYDVSKDKELFPGFDPALVSDLLTSLDLFVDDVVWSDESDYRQLLLADYLFVNQRIADFYRVDCPSGKGFHKVSFDPQRRVGVLTHPYLMTGFAYHKSSSPIHRGVFMVRRLLGRALKPPPIAVAPEDEGVNPTMTTRERVALQTKSAMCQTCHSMINPLGFSLEHYDAVGRFRAKEKDRPVDASGSYKTLSGEQITFDGARQLAEFLAESPETHGCFVRQLFHHIVKQPITAFGPKQPQDLVDAFTDADCNVQHLIVEIMKASALKTNVK